MRRSFLMPFICLLTAAVGCDFGRVSNLTEPSPVPTPTPSPAPAPTQTIPTIAFGEVLRFRFTVDDFECTRAGGRCRSFYVTAPADGQLTVVITPTTQNDPLFELLEMYIVPGADYWDLQPGPRVRAIANVKAGQRYEIRMYLPSVPSREFELRTSLQ